MSNPTANALRAIVKQVVQAADLLDALGTIDQATGEALDRKKQAEAAAAAAEAGLQVAKDALADQEKINADYIQQARDQASAIIGEAADVRKAADAYVEERCAQIKTLESAYLEAKGNADAGLNAVLQKRDEAQADLDAINKKLDAARAAFKAALTD